MGWRQSNRKKKELLNEPIIIITLTLRNYEPIVTLLENVDIPT